MDLSGNTGGSGNALATDTAESARFQEEIQSLMRDSSSSENNDDSVRGSSFTALLGLPPSKAMELLHREIAPPPPPPPPVEFTFRRSPTFPVFVAEESPEASVVPSNSGNNSSPKVKSEPADCDSVPVSSVNYDNKPPPKRAAGKRKEPENVRGKSSAKKSKNAAGETGCDGGGGGGDEKLPYVHVRARRGQATDSHSLAERARREKINARMKLLQELVPGCSKISGTALVLDEIINHVQSLQRQVEFLSMRLAAVNHRIDFGGLDGFLAGENVRPAGGSGGGVVGMEATMWPELYVDGVRRQQLQQIWQVDLLPSHQSSSLWERDDNPHHHHQQEHHGFISSGPSFFSYESANPVSLHASQLKTEL